MAGIVVVSVSSSDPLHQPETIGVLTLDRTRRRQLSEMLGYIAAIHYHIDPDRFDIDLPYVEGVRARIEAEVEAETYETTLRLTARQLLELEIIVDAAVTYLHRGDPPGMDGVDEDDCVELSDWLGHQYTALFAAPEPRH